jgi:hypothetical protein
MWFGAHPEKNTARRNTDYGDDTHCHVEQLNGTAVNWLEKVTDEEYFAYQERR